MAFIFIIYGIIPTPLTNSYFFKMVKTTNQSCLMYITPAFMLKHPDEPPTKWLWKKSPDTAVNFYRW